MNPDPIPPEMGLRIVWWNTKLSPAGVTSKTSNEIISAAAEVLLRLMDVVRADIIVLGEMSDESIAALRDKCPKGVARYTWLPACHRAGKSRFSFCVLSRKDYVHVQFQDSILLEDGKSVTKVGLCFEVRLWDNSQWIQLIVSHWPSRLHLDRQDSGRTHIAAFLRHWIEDHIFRGDPQPNIVLVGDFNDEPFDEGLERYLRATRDHDKIQRNPKLFYNPFWRHLSSFEHRLRERHAADPGTYFHRRGRDTRWRTFDQLIVSSAVLFGKSGWRLDEASTRVVSESEAGIEIRSMQRTFDHLPIIGHIERQYP
ncbi:endonuclease/exonuclease/phosphatase family protein [Roseateles chitinivorans]|uniref:endonuclease/exonuclease/phosphatase family protein n=1 Tax=Roseateles chitinivorans TaxID=2917965 RepID=UPI003D670DB9